MLTMMIAKQLNYCNGCKKVIEISFIEVDNYLFHNTCFTCFDCKTIISGKYQKYLSRYFHPKCYKIFAGLFCNHCKQMLDDKWTEFNGRNYHRNCYIKFIQPKCNICSNPLLEKYVSDLNGNYHTQCHKENILPKCSICTFPLENTYLVDPWGNKYHEHHTQNGVLCNSCSRVISEKITHGGFQFDDGRFLCSLCEASIIKSDLDIEASKHRVIQQLSSVGLKNISENYLILLVDISTLNKKSGLLQNKDLKGFTYIEIHSDEYSIVSRNYEIYILFGLPKIEFDAVLAHELVHVWLAEKNYTFSDIFKEGFCNLASALIYDNDDTKFSRIHLNHMLNNDDSVYGEGYRKCRKLLAQYGWDNLIYNVSNKSVPF